MTRIALAVVLALVASVVLAQPVRCVDASGKVRYVDASQAGQDKCTPVESKVESVSPQPGARVPPPAAKPADKTGAKTGQAPEARLKAAEAKLASAKKALAEQEGIRTGDERNYQRVLDRLQPYQEAVQSAQKEVDQARRDLR